MKTVLVKSVRDLPNVHVVDRLTPNTFLSGQIDDPRRKRTRSPSLLKRIGDGYIVIPDLSTVLAMRSDNRDQIFSDLRCIYDGELRREFGTSENEDDHQWEGKLTVLAAVTPLIDGYHSVQQSLGERFLMTRVSRPSVQAAELAMANDGNSGDTNLRSVVTEVCGDIHTIPKVEREQRAWIAAFAEIIATGRTHVQRSPYGAKEIQAIPVPESPIRLSVQFQQLAKGSAALDGRDVLDTTDLVLVERVGFDSLPPVRCAAILHSLGVAERAVNMPDTTWHYAEHDLHALGLLRTSRKGQFAPSDTLSRLQLYGYTTRDKAA
jgi:hypothetical protein